MRLTTRYILRQLVTSLVLGTAALVTLLWLINSLRFFDAFINKGLAVGTFLKLTMLLMPGFLTFFLPIALFAVILFVYNRMTHDRELVVMQSAGLSRWRIGRPALMLGVLLSGFGYYLTLDAVPRLEAAFNDLWFEIRQELTRIALDEGAFTEVDEHLTIYVREGNPQGDLDGIIIHDRADPGLDVTITARRGALVYEEGQARVVMVQGVRQERDKTTGRVSFLFFDSQSVPIGTENAQTMIRVPENRERPIAELFTLQTGDSMSPHTPDRFSDSMVRSARMEANQRLSKPIANMAFALLALGALLAGQFNRQGRNARVGVAVIAVVLCQASLLGAANLAKADSTYLPLLYVGPLGTLCLGLWWMLRYPRPGRAEMT